MYWHWPSVCLSVRPFVFLSSTFLLLIQFIDKPFCDIQVISSYMSPRYSFLYISFVVLFFTDSKKTNTCIVQTKLQGSRRRSYNEVLLFSGMFFVVYITQPVITAIWFSVQVFHDKAAPRGLVEHFLFWYSSEKNTKFNI